MGIEMKYTPNIASYIHKRFKNVKIIKINYEYLESSFTVEIEVSYREDSTLTIIIPGNSYDYYDFNIDYIKLRIFHAIKNDILNYYIEGDNSYYE